MFFLSNSPFPRGASVDIERILFLFSFFPFFWFGAAFIVVSSLVPYKFSTYSLIVISSIDFSIFQPYEWNEWMYPLYISLLISSDVLHYGFFSRLLYIRNRMLSRYFVCCRFHRHIASKFSSRNKFECFHDSKNLFFLSGKKWCVLVGLVRCGSALRLLFLSLLLALGRLLSTVSRVETPWILNNGNVLHTCFRIGISRRCDAVCVFFFVFGLRFWRTRSN